MSEFRRRLMMGVNAKSSRLPAGYTEVEYIEGTGTQYIKLNSHPSFPSTIKTTILWTFTNQRRLFGADGGAYFGVTANSKWEAGGTAIDNVLANTWYDILFIARNNSLTLEINGVEHQVSRSVYNTGYQVILGVGSASNTVGNANPAKIKRTTYTNNNVITFDGIPCINPNNEVGLYDLVSNTFFGNQGSGTFIAGNSI